MLGSTDVRLVVDLNYLFRERTSVRYDGFGTFRAVCPSQSKSISVCAAECCSVEYFKFSAAEITYSYWTVYESKYLCACRRCAVRIEKSIDTEVAVVLPFAVITTVCIAPVLVEHGVIHHLPYAASHEIVVSIYFFPVVFHRARSDTHRV